MIGNVKDMWKWFSIYAILALAKSEETSITLDT